MAIESPLFQSAMELYGHSISHYNGKHELDRKLVILHLANAVELILKDLVLDSGRSIYKSPKETITIQGCLSALSEANVNLPILNKIELLIDERNALQHRFGSPNELTVIFYMKITKEFFQNVLKDNYAQDLDEILIQFADESELAAYKLGEPQNDRELEKLKELAKIHPLGALLAAWSYFESTLNNFVKKLELNHRSKRSFAMDLWSGHTALYGLDVPEDLLQKINNMRMSKNMAAHGKSEPSKDEVGEAINTIEEVESFFDSLNILKVREQAIINQREQERIMKERTERLYDEQEIAERIYYSSLAKIQEEND